MDTMKNGLLQPNLNFNLVRDGRRSPVYYYDVDLSTARSQAAGTALVLQLTGNAFFVDKNPLLIGAATVHFQDTTFGRAPAPIYCEPGFIARVPFTQLLIENTAQPGMIFRMHYGVDIDFVPGASSSVTVNGVVQVTPATFNTSARVAITNGSNVLVAPAANVAGYRVNALTVIAVITAPTTPELTLLAKSSAPANASDGDIISVVPRESIATTSDVFKYILPYPVNVSAGKGIYLWGGAGNTFAAVYSYASINGTA